MSEAEMNEWIWTSCTKRIAAMIEEYADGWSSNGPSKAAADAIVKKIMAMPVPQAAGGAQK